MATNKEITGHWKTTIIVSASLKNHDITRMLIAQQHRIKISDSIESGSFVFPSSGTAFLVPENHEESGLFEKTDKFVQVHRNSFLLQLTPSYGKIGRDTLSAIQHRFLGSNLRILPVQSNAEIVKGMLAIAKATSKPHVDSIRDRMSLVRTHIIESSPVWEMLRDKLG
ncbi:protein SPO16 homolog [Myripristis murdjan]|uniref:protein SPO16 homolog n=1 Tax=Myripristis murdjan TaxID=586833 RepID=UPI0011761852|nr:uncharacterized protein C1orf146 homolog [Myripristis murdjan]